MKKITAIILSLVMALCLTAAAFATGLTTDQTEKAVTGVYEAGTTTDTDVYKVNIKWGSMAFTFKGQDGGTRTWDPENHKWIAVNPSTPAGWIITAPDDQVTVTNHSSQKVDVTFNLDKAADTPNNIKATLKNGPDNLANTTLPTAVGTTVEGAPSVTGTVALTGDLPDTYKIAQTLFTLTIALAK